MPKRLAARAAEGRGDAGFSGAAGADGGTEAAVAGVAEEAAALASPVGRERMVGSEL